MPTDLLMDPVKNQLTLVTLTPKNSTIYSWYFFTTHLIQRPCYQRGCPCQDPTGNRTTWRPPDHRKETRICSGMVMSPLHQVWSKPSCKTQWKRGEDKADRGRGGKTTWGNGQAWSSASPRGQWRTGVNGGNWRRNHLWCPNDPRG